jgi:hypothetical protein
VSANLTSGPPLLTFSRTCSPRNTKAAAPTKQRQGRTSGARRVGLGRRRDARQDDDDHGEGCTEDGWPESVCTCVLGTRAGDMDALQKCNAALPQDMQDKLTARMSAEMPR